MESLDFRQVDRNLRSFWDDAAIIVAEGIDDLCPYGAVHKHTLEQGDDGTSAVGVGVQVVCGCGFLHFHRTAVSSVQEEVFPLLFQGLRLVLVEIVEEINL